MSKSVKNVKNLFSIFFLLFFYLLNDELTQKVSKFQLNWQMKKNHGTSSMSDKFITTRFEVFKHSISDFWNYFLNHDETKGETSWFAVWPNVLNWDAPFLCQISFVFHSPFIFLRHQLNKDSQKAFWESLPAKHQMKISKKISGFGTHKKKALSGLSFSSNAHNYLKRKVHHSSTQLICSARWLSSHQLKTKLTKAMHWTPARGVHASWEELGTCGWNLSMGWNRRVECSPPANSRSE